MTRTSDITITRLQDALKAVNRAIEHMKAGKWGYVVNANCAINAAIWVTDGYFNSTDNPKAINKLKLQADNIEAILDRVLVTMSNGMRTARK